LQTSGGLSQPEPYTFGQRGQEARIKYSQNKPDINATNIGEVRALNTVRTVKEEFDNNKKLRAAERETALTGSKQDFKSYLARERVRKKAAIFSTPEAYGDLDSDRGGQRLLARASLGFQRIGRGAEAWLGEQSLRNEYATRQNIGKSSGFYALDALEGGSRALLKNTLSASESLVKGGVTNVGTDKTQAAFIAGGFVAGGSLKALQLTGVTTKLKGAFESVKRGGSMLKGLRKGATVGVGTAFAADVATSNKPFNRAFELGGELLSVGAAFELGSGAGRAGVAAARSRPVQMAIRSPAFFVSGALPGAGSRGAGRVLSKAALRKQNLGIPQRQQKGLRISQDKGETVLKTRDRDLRNMLSQQLGGAPVKEVTARYNTLTLERQPFNIKLSRGDFVRFERVPGAGVRKASTPKTPLSKSFKSTELGGGGSQRLLGFQEQPVLKAGGDLQKLKPVRVNEQKQGFFNDPAQSRYAAQNIQADMKADVNLFSQQSPQKGLSLGGGFRSNKLRSRLYERLYERQGQLKTDNYLRELGRVSDSRILPSYAEGAYTPPVNTIKPPALTLKTRSKSLTDFKRDELSVQAPAMASAQNNNSLYRAQITPLTRTPLKNDVINKLDLGLKNFSKPLGGGGSRKAQNKFFMSPPVEKPIKSPRPYTPQKLNTPSINTPRPPRKPGVLFPTLQKNTPKNVLTQSYDVYVRRKGSFNLVGSGLSRASALSLGARRVGNTAAATFKVKPGAYVPKTPGFFGGFTTKNDFYRKGELFIEKPERRIKSQGELSEITFKGLSALRSRGGGFNAFKL
jgi:hypothetical protein